MAGKRTLLVDTDDQGQDSFLRGFKPPKGLADVLNAEISGEDALFQARSNLWPLAGGKSLAGTKRFIRFLKR